MRSILTRSGFLLSYFFTDFIVKANLIKNMSYILEILVLGCLLPSFDERTRKIIFGEHSDRLAIPTSFDSLDQLCEIGRIVVLEKG